MSIFDRNIMFSNAIINVDYITSIVFNDAEQQIVIATVSGHFIQNFKTKDEYIDMSGKILKDCTSGLDKREDDIDY